MMILKQKSSLFFLLLTMVVYSYGQNQPQLITTPTIDSPEQLMGTIFKNQKIDNPIFLNGAVKEVQKTRTTYITPERTLKTTKGYNYSLNKQKQVVSYTSDVEFDEMSPEFLNLEKETIITGDTLINSHNNWYTFKNGQLVTKKEKTEETIALDIFIDSTAYTYDNNKLVKIKSYQREILEEVNEDDYDDITLHFSDYEMSNYSSVNYNVHNLLVSKLKLYKAQDIFISTKTFYQYNQDNELDCYKLISEKHNSEGFNQSGFIKNNEAHSSTQNATETLISSGTYEYDDKGRIIRFQLDNNYNTPDKKDSDVYIITYNKNKSNIIYTNNGMLKKEWQYVNDVNKNPLEEKTYTFINGEKHLDTLTTLKIRYY